MSATQVAKVRAAVHKALERIGTANGHACPESKSNHDPTLHEGLVAAEVRRYAEKRYKAWSEGIKKSGLFSEDDMPEPGGSAILVAGDIYGLSATVNNPASRFDKTLCINALHKHAGEKLSVDLITKIIAEATVLNSPAVKLEVSSVA